MNFLITLGAVTFFMYQCISATKYTCNNSILSGNVTKSKCSNINLSGNISIKGEIINFQINNKLLRKKSPILKTDLGLRNLSDQDHPDSKSFLVDIFVYLGQTQASAWSYRWVDIKTEKSRRVSVPLVSKEESETDYAELKVLLVPRSNHPIDVNVSLELENNVIDYENNMTNNLRHGFPSLYRFDYPNSTERRIRVHTTRTDQNIKEVTTGCSFVAIQRLDRIINEKETDITFESSWQTMLGQSVIDVAVGGSNTFKDGFYIVILRKHNDQCSDKRYDVRFDSRVDLKETEENSTARIIEEGYEIVVNVSEIHYDIKLTTWLIVLVLLIILILLIIWELTVGSKYPQISLTGKVHGKEEAIDSEFHEFIDSDNDDDSDQFIMVDGIRIQVDTKNSRKSIIPLTKEKYVVVKQALSVDERIKCKANAIHARGKKVTKSLAVSDLSTKLDPTLFLQSVKMKSGLYCWMIVLSGIFYLLPVLQLMLGAQLIAKETGSQDICYYNFLCRYPVRLPLLGTIDDWGNFFSNIAYTFCGVLFILAVKIRSIRRRREMVRIYEKNRKNPKILNTTKEKDDRIRYYKEKNIEVEFLNRCGVPEQYGLFYAMGGATIIEGLLSACYHLCPTHESFQFDTTYMYVLSTLIFMKIYQFRHSDITTNAYALVSIVGLMLILETASYYSPPDIYLGVFILTYIFFMAFIGVYLYYGLRKDVSIGKLIKSGYIFKLFKGDEAKGRKENESNCCSMPLQKGDWKSGKRNRKIFFICMILGNLMLAAWYINRAAKSKDGAVSNVLLFIFCANMMGYFLYYIIMKHYFAIRKGRKNEYVSIRSWIYITLYLVFGLISVYIFADKERTTTVSPSVSRNKNAECQFLFFDKHDIWHFGSALAILFKMMALLTLEENNTDIHWNKLDVF